MPIFTIQTPEGKKLRIKADDEDAALEGARHWHTEQVRGRSNPVAGVMSLLNDAVPLVDEATAGLTAAAKTGEDLVTGRRGVSFGDHFKAERDWQKQQGDDFRELHPVAGNLATGAGYALQAIPMFLSGGAAAIPMLAERAAGVEGVKQVAKRVGARVAKNATVGASYAAGNELAGRGSAAERVGAADAAILPGAVAGVAIPGAVDAAAATTRGVAKAAAPVARTVKRAANAATAKVTGAPFLDPKVEVTRRLSERLRADKATPEQFQAILNEWTRVGGPSPAFMDLVAKLPSGGQNTMGLFRGAAMSGSGRGVAVTYGNQVAEDLPAHAVDRTRALTPDTRTVPAVEASSAARIEAAAQPPRVEPGRPGAAVSQRLNTMYDASKARVDEAYDAVRASDAEVTAPTLTELPGRLHAALDEALITPEVMGSLNPGTRSILGEIERLSGQAGRLDRAAQPSAGESLESGIPTGGQGQSPRFPLAQIERVRKAINARLPTAKGEDEVALNIAKREFDRWLNEAVDSGAIEGDPAALQLLRTARGEHARHKTQFAGEDLIQTLTERERHGEGRTVAVAPEDASNVILGQRGVGARPDVTRDLARLRDTLGAESPEWNALRQEARARILGRDQGTAEFGRAWDQFQHDNPELARLLSTPEDAAALTVARREIADAGGDLEALHTGVGILRTPSDQYAAGVTAAGERAPMVRLGAARGMQDAIERPPEGATGVLNTIATATRNKRNLAETFGEEPAADYRQAIAQMVEQLQNARFINPNTGAQTAGRLADEKLVESIPLSKSALIMAAIRKIQSGATLTDGERELLVRLATSRLDDVMPMIDVPMKPGAPRLPPPNPSLLAVPAGQSQGQRR